MTERGQPGDISRSNVVFSFIVGCPQVSVLKWGRTYAQLVDALWILVRRCLENRRVSPRLIGVIHRQCPDPRSLPPTIIWLPAERSVEKVRTAE